ncbi:thymidine phosphorylase family protein [Chitinimonas sp. BJYL2]|uniref:thymidine phosphorylase family protein n=1 Tax=Chitinimonas sp. BJYL2 TaxID=2976696 RepID=UPI0022B5107F|nr:thymidine phosphorylase family protein [Chitinimonas sp. BJYL2]
MNPQRATLRFKPLGIDTAHDHVVYMSAGCHICRAEGFAAQTRVLVASNGRSLIATLNTVNSDLLGIDEASLSVSAQHALGVLAGETLHFSHMPVLLSEHHLRGKIFGERLTDAQLGDIIADTVAGRLSDLHLAAFVTACAGDRLDLDETIALTRAMVNAGERLQWSRSPVVDKHCVGGLPGNRTTPIVVAIVTAAGLTMPKTSSRAITSPAGTADTMETLAPVDLSPVDIRRVVDETGGCIVWGGGMRLSPADDILIRIERPLNLDSDGQLVASILSKKLAAGSERVLIDLPVGPTAKVRNVHTAERLSRRLRAVGDALGLQVQTVITDGTQPVGRGIGPALEARDLVQVLQCDAHAPQDLRDRALLLAGLLLEMGEVASAGNGKTQASALLDSGAAWQQFLRICAAQGGLRTLPKAPLTEIVCASRAGRVREIDNRILAQIAKLAGAPQACSAGVDLHVKLGDTVLAGQPLYTLHAEAPGELRYAAHYAAEHEQVIGLDND